MTFLYYCPCPVCFGQGHGRLCNIAKVWTLSTLLKETAHFAQLLFIILVSRVFSSLLPEKPGSRLIAHSLHMCYSGSWSHSQSFLFSSQLSQYPAASYSLLSFSDSSRHLRFLQRPSLQEGHLCFSSSSGQRDKVLDRVP